MWYNRVGDSVYQASSMTVWLRISGKDEHRQLSLWGVPALVS